MTNEIDFTAKVQLKRTHSSDLRARMGLPGDQTMAIVTRNKLIDGRPVPQVEWIIESTDEAKIRRLLKKAGYPHTKAAVPSPAN